MDATPETAPPDAAPTYSRWARATSDAGDDTREALRELADSYWYCVYAWWRRAGMDAAQAATATQAGFTRWLNDSPPRADDPGIARLREWLPTRLAALAAEGVQRTGESAIEIEPEWAARRYADEPPGEPDAIFQRRWALTVLEFATTTLRDEYAARGEEAFFDELLPFAGFEPTDDARYAAAASRTGRTTGAMRKGVVDFRTRQREVLRAFVADTVLDSDDAGSELTALLCAVDTACVVMTPFPTGEDSPLPRPAAAPLPTALRAMKPDEVFARAMQSVRMTSAGPGGWTPPTVTEASLLFPQYEIVKLLGRGGMGAVYQGRQSELDRSVAIKLLPLEVSVDPEFADRFRREARAMARLSHPNIIGVFDFGTTREGHLFFVMEFIEGANLHDIIHGGGISPEEALGIMAGVCDALSYAHAKGIVHRDIKPANVMVGVEGQAKVADFGLARLIDPDSAQLGHTVAGTVMGTPNYMAPEQMKGMNVDHRADLFSLGVMLYEMLCKETPRGAFDPASKRCGLDKRIDAVIARALATQPERRFQTATEMKTALEPIRAAALNRQRLGQVAASRISVAPPSSAAATAPKEPRVSTAGKDGGTGRSAIKNRRSLGIAFGALLVLATAGGFLFTKPKPLPPRLEITGFEQASSAARRSEDAAHRADATPSSETKDAPLVNSLGMKFVPVPGTKVLFSVWDTRVADYAAYAAANPTVDGEWKTQSKDGVPVGREPEHPVAGVNWEDAQAFCQWLTEKETVAGKLPRGAKYRLPTDAEWSFAVGLPPKTGGTPAENAWKNQLDFPWGNDWPPKGKVGNYADEAFHAKFPPKNTEKTNRMENSWIEGYTEGFATTSPVGSFPANQNGLYDMGGNVWQWCEDWSDASQKDRVLRGASWNSGDRSNLLSLGRIHREPGYRNNGCGFRCVMEPGPDSGRAASPKPPADSSAAVATATKDVPFMNSLGMKFVPVPVNGGTTDKQRVHFSVWDTRVQDYEVFAKETKRVWPKADFEQGPTHPAVNVSWEDAQRFCQWLTEREQAAGRLPAEWRYRLPSDHEWGCAVELGTREDAAKLPGEKIGKIGDTFPWGTQWPPPENAGNYASEELQPLLDAGKFNYINGIIPGYRDGYANTSPVGSYAANRFGLFDLGGNVWQWCEDWFDKEQTGRVLRGAAWKINVRNNLLSSYRTLSTPTNRDYSYGFRCVVSASAR